MATIANMTVDELKQLILDLMEESGIIIDDEPDNRSLEEVFASVERNRWTPPTGSPTPAEIIRTNRDN